MSSENGHKVLTKEGFVLCLATAFYLLSSISLLQLYPWERIGSTYLLPSYELLSTGDLRLEYQLYYSNTDRLLANPPLYYLALAGFIKVFGANIEAVRIMAILINLSIMVAVFALVKNVFSNKAAIYSVSILLFSDPFFSYTFNARPTQLSIALFLFSLLPVVITPKDSFDNYVLPFLSGLLLAGSILSHPFIICYILILPVTFFFFKPPNKSWLKSIHFFVILAFGFFVPIFIYFVWIGKEFPEWWHVQKILTSSDATNNRDFKLSFGVVEFLRTNFFHWNIDFDYKPYKLLAVHRQNVWLGFPWILLYLASFFYCFFSIWLKKVTLIPFVWRPYCWLTMSIILAVAIPGIAIPKGGVEYLLPIHILFIVSVGIFISDVISCKNPIWARKICLLFCIFVILSIISLRVSYNYNVFKTINNEPSYRGYISKLRKSIPTNFNSVVGPHLIAAGFIDYPFFDFYSLYDYYAYGDRKDKRKGWRTDHFEKIEFFTALYERLLSKHDLLITNTNSIKKRTRRIIDLFASSGFYHEVSQVESKFYGLTKAYLPNLQRWIPFLTEINDEGDLLVRIRENQSQRLNAIFLRYRNTVNCIPKIYLSSDGSVFRQIELKKENFLSGKNGFFWVDRNRSNFSIIRISQIDQPLFIAICASNN